MVSLARVMAERLEDIADTSLRAREPAYRRWALKFMHSRVKRESSKRKVVRVV